MMRISPLYSPSVVYRAKRSGELDAFEAKPSDAESKKGAEAAQKKEENDPTKLDVRPEGDLGILWDASRYLEGAVTVVDQALNLTEQMRKLAEEATDLKLDDNDRKAMNKALKDLRREFNQKVGEARVQGDALFSGRFSKSPKRLPIGPGEEEKMNLSVPAMTTFEMGLDRIAINSQVNARKTVGVMDKVVEDIRSVMNAFRQKRDLVALKMKSLQRSDEKDTSAKVSMDSVRSTSQLKYVEFKILQEERAARTGRTEGLLIDRLA